MVTNQFYLSDRQIVSNVFYKYVWCKILEIENSGERFRLLGSGLLEIWVKNTANLKLGRKILVVENLGCKKFELLEIQVKNSANRKFA